MLSGAAAPREGYRKPPTAACLTTKVSAVSAQRST